MSEKKVVRRSVAITLGIMCIIFIAGLGGALACYTITINNKENEVNSLKLTINQLDTTIAHQNNIIADQSSTINYLNGTINDLKRITLVYYYWAKDIRSLNGTPYFYVYGSILNIGNETAYNCTIHVKAYQGFPLVTLTIDTDIVLGTIYGQSLFRSLQGEYIYDDGTVCMPVPSPSWVTINASIPYSGNGITGWSLSSPQWATSP